MALPRIPIAKPWMDDREADAARRAILSGWVTQGPEVEAFERAFADAVGAPHACAVSSCTAALHLALLACGIGPGDDVVTVSHSFIATANSIRYCGARPVFVDVDLATFNIDPTRLAEAMTPQTKAILAVHQLGMPCDLPAILDVARAHGVPVVEDAACAVGSEARWEGQWQRIGRPHGDIACFSFHPRKIVSTGDGGMLVTRSEDHDRRFRLLRQHGMDVSDSARHRASQVIAERYPTVGFNYRMTDIQAAVGREQLKRLPAMIARRRELAGRYVDLLRAEEAVVLPVEPVDVRTNWQTFAIRLAPGLDQRDVMQRLLDAGVATRRGVMNAHREASYPKGTWSCGPAHDRCTCAGEGCAFLRRSEQAQDTAIALPMYHDLTDDEQVRVAAALRTACAGVSR